MEQWARECVEKAKEEFTDVKVFWDWDDMERKFGIGFSKDLGGKIVRGGHIVDIDTKDNTADKFMDNLRKAYLEMP